MTNPQYVKRHLMNPQALSSLTYPFLKNINIILESAVDPDDTLDIDAPPEASFLYRYRRTAFNASDYEGKL